MCSNGFCTWAVDVEFFSFRCMLYKLFAFSFNNVLLSLLKRMGQISFDPLPFEISHHSQMFKQLLRETNEFWFLNLCQICLKHFKGSISCCCRVGVCASFKSGMIFLILRKNNICRHWYLMSSHEKSFQNIFIRFKVKRQRKSNI